MGVGEDLHGLVGLNGDRAFVHEIGTVDQPWFAIEPEVFFEELIHRLAFRLTVVVALGGDVSILYETRFIVEAVDSAHKGKFDLGSIESPVPTTGNEHHGPGSAQGSDFGIVSDMMWTHVNGDATFARTAAIKVGGDHDTRCGGSDALIKSGEQKRLGPTAGGPCHTHTLGIDLGQG